MTMLARALSRTPRISSDGDREHEEHRRQVDHAAVAGRLGDRVRQRDAEQRVEQRVEVAAPADRDRGDRDAVLEDQVPADDPGDELAQRGVARRCRRCRRPGSTRRARRRRAPRTAQVTPASTKDRMIAGPASPIASPMITKMPVPMMAPMPSAVRSRTPTARLRPPPDLVSWTSCSADLRANGPRRVGAAVAMAPNYRARPRRQTHRVS